MLFPSTRLSGVSSPRVVVTGAGIVTALGMGWRSNADGFRSGRTAFRPVQRFDVSSHRAKVAAEVDLPNTLPPSKLSRRQQTRLSHADRLLLHSALECWNQAGWPPSETLPVVLGTTAAGMVLGEDYYRQALASPTCHSRQPTRALHYQAQTQARLMTAALGCAGPILILSNACATGANAIGHAWELIRTGKTTRALAGGYEGLASLLFAGFDSLQALSPTICRPFDAKRDGLALGEGAALLALETLDSARERSAEVLGEIIGYGTTIDLHHLTQPHPEGNAALKSMQLACQAADITPAEVDYINAHGTGTVLNDAAEATAITRWAGSRVSTLPVSSTKASIGHLLGAAGAVEAVVCLMALREQFLPPELAFETPDPACTFPVINRARAAKLEVALSNSFGFGGINATLLFKRWK